YQESATAFTKQLQYVGYKRAILSSVRNMLPHDGRPYFQTIGQSKKKVLLLWGKQDAVIPFDNSTVVRKLIPQAEFLAVDQCGHHPNYEKPELVNPVVLKFLGAP